MVDLKTLQPNQKLRIKTKDGVNVIGILKKIAGNRLEIENPQTRDGSSLGRVKWVHQSDIDKLLVDGNEGMKCDEKNDQQQCNFSPSITKEQRDGIEKLIEKCIYINQYDEIYHAALKNIRACFCIGVHAEKADKGRICKPQILQIATQSNLYIFDLLQMRSNRIFEDLRSVLENYTHLKVVFESPLILDCLNNHFNLDIKPFCDLRLMLTLERKIELTDINGCVMEIFGFHPEIETKQNDFILQRPFNATKMRALSSKVAYLIPLYNQLHLLKLNEKYGATMREYSQISKGELCSVITNVHNNKIKEVIRKFSNSILDDSTEFSSLSS